MKEKIRFAVMIAVLIAVVGLTLGIPTVLAEEPEFVVENHVLVAYNGLGGDVVIPGNLGITSIGYHAFGWRQCEHYEDVTSVTFCEGIERVEAEAFASCFNLQRVVLPNTIRYLGAYAFVNCSALHTVENADAVVAAFDSTSWAYYGTFEGCDALENRDEIGIYLLNGYPYDNYSATTLTGYQGPGGNVTIPSDLGITRIVRFWWRTDDMRDSITGITLPTGLTSIDAGTFSGFGNLTHVDMPDTVTYIGKGAFQACPSLRSLYLPDTITSFGNGSQGYDDGSRPFDEDIVLDVNYNSYAMRYCVANHLNYRVLSGQDAPEYIVSNGVLTAYNGLGGDVVIPKDLGLTAIGGWVFELRSDILSVTLPEGITSIGECAFQDCYRMKAVHLPETLTTLKLGAFEGCTALSALTLPRNVDILPPYYTDDDEDTNYFYVDFCDADMPLVIYKDSKAYATILNAGLANPVRLADSEDEFIIWDHVLIKYTGGNTSVVIPGSVSEIAPYAFCRERRLKAVEIRDGIERIGKQAFAYCEALSSIKLAESVKEIGDDAFRFCISLKSITIPASVKRIGYAAFDECVRLKEVILNEGLIAIEGSAFDCCSSLNRIRLPRSLTECDLEDAFRDDTVLEVYEGSEMAQQCLSSRYISYEIIGAPEPEEPEVSEDAFVVEGSTLTAYKGPGGAVVIPEELGIRRIGEYAFSGRNNVTSITLASTIENTGYYNDGLYGAKGLQAIYVVEGNEKYSSRDGVLFSADGTELIFYPPARPGEYTIPEDTTSLENYCFKQCTALASIKLSGTVADRVFRYVSQWDGNTYDDFESVCWCPSLTRVVFTSESRYFKIQDNCILSKDGKTLCWIPSNIVGRLEIPEGVTEVYYRVGVSNSGIESISIPASMTDLEEIKVFYSSDLKAYTVNPDNPAFCVHDDIIYSKDSHTLLLCPRGYEGCHFIPEGTRTIGASAFDYCKKITGIVIPCTVTTIEGAAFQSCDSLTDIIIPMSVKSMGSNIFAYHDADNYDQWYGGPVGVYAGSVAEAYCAAQDIDYYLVEEEIPESGIIILPRKLTTIEPEAFTGIAANYIEIPDTVTYIAVSAFKPGTRLIVERDSYAETWAKAHGFVTMYR